MTNANCFALRATSATRSVPLWCFRAVKDTSAPQSKATFAMRMSSVAIITESRFFALRHRFQTCCRSDLPKMRYNGFPGKRVELHRAGIMPTALFIGQLFIQRRYSCRGGLRPPRFVSRCHVSARIISAAAGKFLATQSAVLAVVSCWKPV